jgi:epoxyqueuosine reductase
MSRTPPTDQVLRRCRELGFALAGVCRARPTDYGDELRAWLGAGRHGEMAYLKRNVEAMTDPAALLAGVRSIVCVADRYAGAEADAPRAGAGRVARYARGDDYHRVMKRRLRALADELRARFPEDGFRVCVDTAPLLEREHARRAGLGSVGKHTLLIEPGAGSYLLLGELLTTLDLEPSRGATDVDPCSTCTRCIDACPTGAIAPWSVDATRCISYLTIEHRSAIDPSLHDGMEDWIFGCDVCQEVCPHNQPTERSRDTPLHDAYAPRRDTLDLLEILGWGEEDRRSAFTRSAMKRAKLPMLKRNALIAAANALRTSKLPQLRAAIDRIARDTEEHDMVRDTAARIADGE